jgi:hypothetical protein
VSADWYAASLTEIAAFLDKFENQKTATVRADSDLVAALIGVLEGAQAVYLTAQYAQAAATAAALLETER